MNWKLWLKGLAAAAAGGATTGAAQSLSTGTIGKATAMTAGAGAIVSTVTYLLQSPLVTTTPANTTPTKDK